MSVVALVRTEAFVVKAFRFGETSMIYRLFTRDAGVVPVIARGARRPRSRFGGTLDLFHRLGVSYHTKGGREIQTLTSVELLAEHGPVVRSLERMEAAGSWFRFLRAVVPDGLPSEPLFELAAVALARLERAAPAGIRRWETYHRAAAGALLGLAPDLEACVVCGRPLPDGRALAFAVGEGGLLCAGCRASHPRGEALSAAGFALLTLYHHPDYTLLESMEPVERKERDIQDIIRNFIRHHADLRPGAA